MIHTFQTVCKKGKSIVYYNPAKLLAEKKIDGVDMTSKIVSLTCPCCNITRSYKFPIEFTLTL